MQPFVNCPARHWRHRALAVYTRIQTALLALCVGVPVKAAGDEQAASPIAWPIGELVTIVLFLLGGWAVVSLLKRRMRTLAGDSGAVRIVGAAALGARERAVILHARGRVFLVGVTPHMVSLIAELGDEPAPGASPGEPPRAAGYD
jgi:flagellar protein FliO/FliZ